MKIVIEFESMQEYEEFIRAEVHKMKVREAPSDPMIEAFHKKHHYILSESEARQIRAQAGMPLNQIKTLREISGIPLKEAKEFIESLNLLRIDLLPKDFKKSLNEGS